MTAPAPRTAMVLAAGRGLRMRPITETLPKPLVKIAGKALLDWGLDALAAARVETAIVNVHHLPEQIVEHVRDRTMPKVSISDESDKLLDSAGGIVKALPLLGRDPFYVINADTFWIDVGQPNLTRLALAWDMRKMDILLMLADPRFSVGHTGKSDFILAGDGRLVRSDGDPDGLIYAGAAIVDPAILARSAEPHSLNVYFDTAIQKGRLHGMRMDGRWITVGTPDAIPLAEEAVAKASRR